MSLFSTIYKKELIDSLRDRRAIMVAIFPALIAPVLMAAMFHFMINTQVSSSAITIKVIGAANAPDLISYMNERDIKVEEYEGNPKEDIKAKNVTMVLEIPEDFEDKFSQSQPATLYLHADGSLNKSRAEKRRVEGVINGYSRTVGAMRLMLIGVNPQIARAVNIQDRDYSTDDSRAGQILAGLQMFILMAAFFGSAPVAIDTTAGERERNSLEPLLVHPMSSISIMMGKWFTVVTFGMAATIIAIVMTAIAFEFVDLTAIGIDPQLTLNMQISMALLLLPSALLAAGLQMLTSLFAKTFKEAQSYLGMLIFIPMIPVIITMIGNVKTEGWMFLVPILGQQQILTNIMRGETLVFTEFVTVSLVTIALAAVIIGILTKLLRSERVVYGS